jgi:hypothetical protein
MLIAAVMLRFEGLQCNETSFIARKSPFFAEVVTPSFFSFEIHAK